MKASKIAKAYLWAEVLFMTYLVLKPKSEKPTTPLEDIENRLKEELHGQPEDP